MCKSGSAETCIIGVNGCAFTLRPTWNLQQIPSRSELGKLIKRLLISDKGTILLKVDYCITGDALIPTELGLLRLDQIPNDNGILSLPMQSSVGETDVAVHWKYMGEKETLALTTKSGNCVRATPDHKMRIFRDGKIQWIQAQDCRIGDMMLLPRNKCVRTLPIMLSLSDVVSVARNNSSTGHYNVYQEGSKYFIKIKHGEVYYRKGGYVSVSDAVNARDAYCIANDIPVRNRSFRNIVRPTIMTPDLAFLIGAIVGDGWYTRHASNNEVRFACSDKNLIDTVVSKFNTVFGLSPNPTLIAKAGTSYVIHGVETVLHNDMWEVRVRNNSVCNWLEELGLYSQHGLREGLTASNYARVPWSILQADEESQLAFLSALIECDGHIKNGVSYGISSASPELLSGVRAILNSHGYITKHLELRRSKHTKTGNQIVIHEVGLGRGSSQDLYKRLSKYAVSKHLTANDSTDRLGIENGVALKNYHMSPILDIKSGGVEKVYDMTMQDQSRHAFVANGLVVSNCAHEVRGWSIISGDQGVADVFQHGADLRQQFRFVPDPYIAFKIEMEGDVHKLNASYFFGVAINAVTKVIRNAVKTVIFGLIYQQGDEGLAASTGRDVEEIVDIKSRFLKRFPVGLQWFDKVKNFAKKHLFVESPIGRRRNLTSLLVDESVQNAKSVINRSLRQAVNSPVQGFGSDLMMAAIRLFDTYCYDYYLETGEYPQMKTNVSVHDSLTVEVGYDWVWLAVDFIERCMTTGAVEVMQNLHGMKFTSIPEMEFEIGATEKDTKAWDFSVENMRELITKAIEQRVNDFGEKIDIDEVVDSIMEDQWHLMPMWAKKQYEANKIPCRSKTESVLTAADKKRAKQLIAERDGVNVKKHIKAYRELIDHTAEDAHMKQEDKDKLISGYKKKIEELKANV